MRNPMLLFAVLTTAGVACSDAPRGTEATSESTSTLDVLDAHAHARGLTVVTRNVYLGLDIAPILAAPTPQDVPLRVADAWLEMISNDFAARAGVIAGDIARTRPALVGLEEVALFRRTPHDGGTVEVIDYLAELQSALAARGLDYVVAVVQNDSDVVAPMLAGVGPQGAPLLDQVEMIDRDVILARSDVRTSHPLAARYAAALPVSLGGTNLEIVRGWASVVVDVGDGRPFRFVATHLEEQLAPPVQLAQAAELLLLLWREWRPVVLTGDFNSAADGSQTPTYGLLTHGGFVDVWSQARPHASGYTCCEPADLHLTASLDQRIDLVLVRNPSDRRHPIEDHPSVSLLGVDPRDRTASGLWASDHAGIVASFSIRDESGQR